MQPWAATAGEDNSFVRSGRAQDLTRAKLPTTIVLDLKNDDLQVLQSDDDLMGSKGFFKSIPLK